ncbi:liver-expressed antimicrobial peptide 2 [Pagrus major]|uniref:liver-expressed antimicrobial peptide 2 n=1 Tax=Pagrus major TaxID=143350 RepID=UPI003CC88D38
MTSVVIIKLISTTLILYLPLQVNSLPLPDDWNGLLQRTKRSLLWRWNSMKPVGASCRDHMECGTKYCRYGTFRKLKHFQLALTVRRHL